MVRYISDRMAVMYLGGLVEIGPADDVFFEPKHPYTQTLIASNPEADKDRARERPSTNIQGEIPSPVNVCRVPICQSPKAMPECHRITPKLLPVSTDNASERLVACHLYLILQRLKTS